MKNGRIDEYIISGKRRMIAGRSFVLSVFMLVVAISAAALISARGVPVVIAINLDKLPMEINSFRGSDDSFPQTIYDHLNADRHIYRHYRSADGEQVDLYIGYYGTAKGGRTGHNPFGCLPSVGWGIITSEKVSVVPESAKQKDGKGPRINYLLARRGASYVIMYHWYQTRGDRVLDTGIQQNVERFFGRVLDNRNDGAFVQITVPCGHEGIEQARELGKSFAAKVLALLPSHWPVEMVPK